MQRHLVGLLALGALTGCGAGDTAPQDLGTFNFEIREQRDSLSWTQVPIELIVSTETQSPCLTHALKADVGFGNDFVIVDVARIKLPDDVCIPSAGPAEFSTPLGFGPVREDNPFYLRFERDDGQVDRYLVIVSKTEIDIAPLQAAFTTPIARRIPRG